MSWLAPANNVTTLVTSNDLRHVCVCLELLSDLEDVGRRRLQVLHHHLRLLGLDDGVTGVLLLQDEKGGGG